MKKNIIVGTDFSQGSYAALEVAIDVANNTGLDIELVWVRKAKELPDKEQMEAFTRLAEQRLSELCKKYAPRLTHNAITYKMLQGKVANALSEEAKANNTFAIVIGANGASGFEKYFIGSTAVRIVQDAPCPVLTIREGYDYTQGVKRMVVPVRIHVNSRQKVPHAAQVAKTFGAHIYVLGLISGSEEEKDIQPYIKQINTYLDKEMVEHSHVIRHYSNYCDTVLQYADEVKANCIIINTEQDRIISQFFLGTNAQQIVHKSQIPVICLHPKDIVTLAK